MHTVDLYGLEREALEDAFEPLGFERYRAGQAYRWLYARRRLDPADWTDFALEQRRLVAETFRIGALHPQDRLEATDGTVKHRLGFDAGDAVEAVYMPYSDRDTYCISSQVGCALGCRFCLTATMGLRRQLSAGEILGQVRWLLETHGARERPPNLVFMGMGEPLHNYDAVTAAIRVLTDPDGFGWSRRRITVSTVGLVDRIERLARESVRPRLAVSLNAADDAARSELMPVNRRWPIERLIEAVRDYSDRSGDAVTFEYVLLAGVNDRDADIDRLRRIAARAGAKINLIPFNAVPDRLPFRPPERDRILAVRDRLLARGARAGIRWSRGAEARAACGQLALEETR